MPFYARKISFSFILKYLSCLFVCFFFLQRPYYVSICPALPTFYICHLHSISSTALFHFHPTSYLSFSLMYFNFISLFNVTIPIFNFLYCIFHNTHSFLYFFQFGHLYFTPPLIFPLSSIPIFSICHIPLWP